MNILPDYLITYMPEIEEALEELRLSVIDHAYELLQRLDVDELSTDEVRQKLELYDIRIDNMSGDWLPNGRFYRLYPSIKHHRSRHNAIKAIAKSGGQFEGLWSTEFSNKSEYNFKDITVARHYELQNNADGYFFVNGNTEKTARGTVVSSAAQALTTDVLINQALPAGYTYLYIPWPRPVYPGDSSYFYNVNMLMYDRLHYAEDCDHYWKKIGIDYNRSNNGSSEVKPTYSIYVCVDNSEANRYCSAPDSNISVLDVTYSDTITEIIVGDSKEYTLESEHAFTEIAGDAPFAHSFYNEDVPASTKYDWKNGTNTPWRAPYWIDYHYMNAMKRSLPTGDHSYAGTWPVTESGVYFDENGDEALELDDAVTYSLTQECKELSDSRSTFPTKCYLKDSVKTTEPNRLQKFTPKSLVLTIKNYDTVKDNEDIIDALCKVSRISKSEIKTHSSFIRIDNEYEINKPENTFTNKLVITLTDSKYKSFTGELYVSYTLNGEYVELHQQQFSNGIWTSDSEMPDNANIENVVVYDSNVIEFVVTEEIREQFEHNITLIENCDYEFEYKAEYSIDENDLKEPDRVFSPKEGPYRWDKLADGFFVHIRETLNHFKQYKPFWNEKAPWLEMCKSKYASDIQTDETVNHSLYNWINFKQSENRPAIPFNASVLETYSFETKSIIKDNEPPISEVTFTSCDRPTRGKLDPVYIGYLSDDVHEQEVNQPFFGDNSVYTFDLDPDDEKVRAEMITYDPEYYYTAISLGYCVNDEQEHKINHIKDSMYDSVDVYAQPIGDPYTKEFSIRCVENSNHNYTGQGNIPMYNYITFKKSLVHKLWFDSKHKDVPFKYEQVMYNMCGSHNVYKYTENRVHIEYNVLGVYTEKGVKLEGVYCELHCCTVSDNTYIIYCRQPNFNHGESTKLASYVLFTVKVTAGSCRELEYASVEHSAQYHLGTSVHKSTDIGEFDYDE